MSDTELGYKLTYAMVLFLISLHIFFLIFFTESKIRLSSKFRTSYWKKQITGVQFDKILYLEAISQDSDCSKGFNPYPITLWPGTTGGVHLKEYQSNYPCKMILNKIEDIAEYRLIESYSSGIGDLFSTYVINTPFDNLCYDKKGRCYCPEQLFTNRAFRTHYPKQDMWKRHKRINNISSITEIPLSKREQKTFCAKNVTDFTIFDQSCKGIGVECNGICIKNERSCPDYSAFRDHPRLHNKLISDFTIDYKRFPCSALNKIISYTTEYPPEFNHSLSNYRSMVLKDKNRLHEKCFSNVDFKRFEDIVLVDRLPVAEIYNDTFTGIDTQLRTKIENQFNTGRAKKEFSFINKFINKNEKQIKDEEEYFNIAGITHFEINKNAIDCPKTLIQDINSSFTTAKRISQVNVTNINLLEFIYIYFLFYLFYKHFSLLQEETRPEQKFYYVRYILLVTFVFFCLNALVYYSNNEYKEEIIVSIKHISDAIDHKCYSSNEYNSHLIEVMGRLKQFATLSFSLYENLLIENVAAIIMIVLVIWSMVPLFEIFRIQKPEEKDS